MSRRDLVAQFRRDLGGVIAGGDDEATVLGIWLAGRSPQRLVTACVLDLPPADRSEFMRRWRGPWDLVLVAHARHPCLGELATWTEVVDDDVILLATPSGPPPPAVFALVAP